MNDRTKNLMAALAAIAIAIVLLAPNRGLAPASVPTTEDLESAGYAGLFRWLEHEDRAPVSHRTRFDRLDAHGTGNLLMLTWPFTRHVELEEWAHLKRFLNAGNRLLLLVAPMGSEGWTFGGSTELAEVYEQLAINAPEQTSEEPVEAEPAETSEEAEAIDAESLERLFSSEPVDFKPALDDPLFDGVDGLSLSPTSRLPTDFGDGVSATALLKREDGSPGAAWFLSTEAVPSGFFLFTHPDLLNNEGLREPGQQHLARNLFSQFVPSHGHVIFDDFHHGLSDVYDAQAFFSDPRLWWSVLAMMLLWLVYIVFYNARLGPIQERADEISNAAFARRTGNLYARHASTEQVNEKLLEAFNNQYRRRYHRPVNGGSVCDLIAGDYRFDDRDRRALEQIERSPKMSPLRVQNALARLYRKLDQER